MKKVDLSSYKVTNYTPGRNKIVLVLWYITNAIIFKSMLFPFNRAKVSILRLFGASIGKGVVIKPNVNIKYPWYLVLGNYVWIGESVWIDNLSFVKVGDNSCISQGAFLLCGNHNYKKENFELMVQPIEVMEGCWIGARSIVCPGSVLQDHCVLSVSSVASGILESHAIYSGNPARKIRTRNIH